MVGSSSPGSSVSLGDSDFLVNFQKLWESHFNPYEACNLNSLFDGALAWVIRCLSSMKDAGSLIVFAMLYMDFFNCEFCWISVVPVTNWESAEQ